MSQEPRCRRFAGTAGRTRMQHYYHVLCSVEREHDVSNVINVYRGYIKTEKTTSEIE